jgi:Ni/Fe-hydrogenase subunit HybB-like protein
MTAIDTPLPSGSDQTPAEGVRQAVLRPFAQPGRGYWLLAAVLTVVVLTGLFAWIVQLRDGMGAGGYNDKAFWAVYLADVVTFIGVSYGGAVISAILRLTGADWRAPLTRLAEGTAVVTVLVGAALLVPHIGRPERIWRMLTQPNLSSPIFWDFAAVMTYTTASMVFFVLPLVPDMAILRQESADRLGGFRRRLFAAVSRGWVGAPRQRRALHGALGLISIMIIPLAVSVHSVLSWTFSLTSRPWWHESIWAPYFVVAALYSGVALVILVVAAFRRAYHLEAFITERHFVRLGFIMAAFAATYLYLTFADILPGSYVGERGTARVFYELLAGRYAVYFWIFFVGGGLLPLLLVALPWTRNIRGMVIASSVAIPAMWLKRMLMVVEPANYDRIQDTFGSFHFTWVSVSITLASVAVIPLLLMLLFRALPLLSIDEMEEVDGGHGKADERPQVSGALSEHISGRGVGSGSGDKTGPVQARVEEPGTTSRSGRLRWIFRAAGSVALIGVAIGALAFATAAPARAADKKSPATITLTGEDTGKAVRLTATLTGQDSKPLPKAEVQFQQATDVFGKKAPFIPLKSVMTNDKGVASLTYKSTVAGKQRFAAKYAGNTTTAPATASTVVDIQKVQFSVYKAEESPILANVGKVTRWTLLSIVAAVWLTLITQVVRIWRVCGDTSAAEARG